MKYGEKLLFQWAPTLGGECYDTEQELLRREVAQFQWAPTLGGECYWKNEIADYLKRLRFNGHPPLGVNATKKALDFLRKVNEFCFNGHPPLGVNAT